jgi:hypothetical protein
VRHYGSTYYFFGEPVGVNTHIDLFTSTTGTSFTLNTANVITTGTSGAWDAYHISTSTVYSDGALWHMLYSGWVSGGVWQAGYATASSAQLLLDRRHRREYCMGPNRYRRQ